MQTPLIYKQIKTQYVFMIEKDGLLKIHPTSDIPKEIKFNSVKEARGYVNNYKIQL